jgi:serine/threonine protein kinase
VSSFPGAGTILDGRFRLHEQVERSERGDVFRASDQHEALTCRVELIAASGRLADEIELLARREVLLSERFNRPGFLRALGWGRISKTQLYVARELPDDAKPLDLESGSLGERAARLLDAARRVETLQSMGIAHRDLGPHALFQGVGGEVLLGGFSLAKAEGLEEPEPGVKGFPHTYPPGAAPELLTAPETADSRADAYALGVLLFTSLTGDPPFPGPTLFDLAAQHEAVRSERRTSPLPSKRAPGVPELLDNLCQRSLSLDPSERVPSATAFASLLQIWLDSLGVESPSEELPVAVPVPVPVAAAATATAAPRPFFPVDGADAAPETPSSVELLPELVPWDVGSTPADDEEPEELSPEEAAALFSSTATVEDDEDGDDEEPEELSAAEATAIFDSSAVSTEPAAAEEAPEPTSASEDIISLSDVMPGTVAAASELTDWDPFSSGSGELDAPASPKKNIHDQDTDRLPKMSPLPPPPTPTLADMPAVSAPEIKKREDAAGPDLGTLDLSAPGATVPSVAAALPEDAAPPPAAPAALPSLPEDEPEEEIELLSPDAFGSLTAQGPVLVMAVRAKGFEVAVAEIKHLDGDGFKFLLLDMSQVAHLGGNHLEALTEIVALATKKGLAASMFCLKADMQSLIKIMDMGASLPTLLRARNEADAVAEVSP